MWTIGGSVTGRKTVAGQCRTTINLDDELIKKAAELTGRREKPALVRLGLEALTARESARRLARPDLTPWRHVASQLRGPEAACTAEASAVQALGKPRDTIRTNLAVTKPSTASEARPLPLRQITGKWQGRACGNRALG